MKKIFLIILIFLLPSALLSYDLSFSKKFSINVQGDLLRTYVNITVEDEKEKKINEKMAKFNEYIKSNTSIIKKNGSFTVTPRYKYNKHTQTFVGYMGSLRYTVESKDAGKLSAFLDKLIEIKEDISSRKVKLNISSLSWILSKKLFEQKQDDLRLDAISWIESYSKNLNKNCEIKRININGIRQQSYRGNQMMAMADTSYMSKSISSSMPTNSQKEISINPSFLLECK